MKKENVRVVEVDQEQFLLGRLLSELETVLRAVFRTPIFFGGGMFLATSYERKQIGGNRFSITIRPEGWSKADYIVILFHQFGEQVVWYQVNLSNYSLVLPGIELDGLRATIRPQTQRAYDWVAIGNELGDNLINRAVANYHRHKVIANGIGDKSSAEFALGHSSSTKALAS